MNANLCRNVDNNVRNYKIGIYRNKQFVCGLLRRIFVGWKFGDMANGCVGFIICRCLCAFLFSQRSNVARIFNNEFSSEMILYIESRLV